MGGEATSVAELEEREELEEEEDGVTLDCGIERCDGEVLELWYRVTNGSDQAIFLTTPLTEVGDDGRLVAVPRKAYTYVDEEGVLHITKRWWPVPEGMDVYREEVPRSTRVEMGQGFGERVSMNLPLPIAYPYRSPGGSWSWPREAEDTDTIVEQAEGIVFSIGYFGREVHPAMGDEVDSQFPHSGILMQQLLIESGIIFTRISVQDITRKL